jgi:hypothetical protein
LHRQEQVYMPNETATDSACMAGMRVICVALPSLARSDWVHAPEVSIFARVSAEGGSRQHFLHTYISNKRGRNPPTPLGLRSVRRFSQL